MDKNIMNLAQSENYLNYWSLLMCLVEEQEPKLKEIRTQLIQENQSKREKEEKLKRN